MSYLISKVVISSLLWAYVMAAPVEDQADNRSKILFRADS